MSRGQYQTRTRSTRTSLRRCNNKWTHNTIIIDADKNKIDIIIVDTPESSNHKSKCSRNPNKKHFPNIIPIDEEDDDDIGFGRVNHYATSSKTLHPSSSNSYPFEGFDSDECQVLTGKAKSCTKYPKRVFGTHSSECSTSSSDTSERDISEGDMLETEDSESDSSDCEILDGSSGNIREEWEKAALKKKIEKRHTGSKNGLGAFGSLNKSVGSPCEVNMNSSTCDISTVQDNNGIHSDVNTSPNRPDDPLDAADILTCVTEEHPFKLKRNSSGVSDNAVGEGGHERCDSENKKEPLSVTSLHKCHSQPKVSCDHEATPSSCGQDIPLQNPFSCDGVSSVVREEKGASLSTEELPDEPQDEDIQRYEDPSVSNILCSSRHMLNPQSGRYEDPSFSNIPYSTRHVANPQTGKDTDLVQDSSSFQLHSGCAAAEQNNYLNEQHDDMLCTHHSFGKQEAISQGSLGNFVQGDVNPGMSGQPNRENINMVSDIQNDIIGERERLKESEEYKRAEEEEWASRQRQLQIQSEEAQRLRKRKKAETLRLLDMERRQKQRVEEIRESQKRDEETINLKEQHRLEIQKELEKLEMKHGDMASLLRGLGINVGGGLYPLSHEVNAAYKQALLRFHPDRASRADIRQQVEAEEKFKLISRLKEKLLPVAY